MKSVLLIGYGNPGRLDDGLGPALAEAVRDMADDHLTVDSDYQLTVEDAAELMNHDVVIFADADVSGPEPFHFSPLEPVAEGSFTSHSVRPEALVGLAAKLFSKAPASYALGIRGYVFDDFGESLSDKADRNLKEAISFIRDTLKSRDFTAAVQKHGK